MGFDESDFARFDVGAGVGIAKCAGLSRCARGVDALRTSIARRADTFEHRVNRIAVAFGIGQALHHQHARAFADHRAIGIAIKRTSVARRRKGLRLAEAHEHENIVERIDAAGDDHVALARNQLHRAEVKRTERAGTRRIDDAVGSVQIQTIGDATGHHVTEQTGE